MGIRIGEPIPISLQLFDGATDKRPVVTVVLPNSEVLKQVELKHSVRGLYLPSEEDAIDMPDENYVVANYVVYDGTKEDETYARVSETFTRDVIPETVSTASNEIIAALTPKEIPWIIGRVRQEKEHEGFVVGRAIQ